MVSFFAPFHAGELLSWSFSPCCLLFQAELLAGKDQEELAKGKEILNEIDVRVPPVVCSYIIIYMKLHTSRGSECHWQSFASIPVYTACYILLPWCFWWWPVVMFRRSSRPPVQRISAAMYQHSPLACPSTTKKPPKKCICVYCNI